MPRPRAPQDPGRWPEPCGRCGEHRQLVVRWPDAHVCNACYLRAKRTRGTCRCGHVGLLPGIIKGAPACRACSGIRMNLDCRTCGREDEIYRDNQCWACVLAAQIDTLLRHPDTGTMNPELVPLADALKAEGLGFRPFSCWSEIARTLCDLDRDEPARALAARESS